MLIIQINITNTALISAACTGHLGIINALLAHGADVNCISQYGDTALTWVARNGNAKVVNALLNNGADISYANGNGVTALTLVTSEGYRKLKKVVMKTNKLQKENLANANKTIEKINSILVNQNNFTLHLLWMSEIIKIMKHYECYINPKVKTISLNFHKLLQKVFINSLKFGKENYSLLHIAVLNDWRELISYLIINDQLMLITKIVQEIQPEIMLVCYYKKKMLW